MAAPNLKNVAWVVIETLPRGPDRWEVAALLATAGALGPPSVHRPTLRAFWRSEAEAVIPRLTKSQEDADRLLQPTGLPGHASDVPAALLVARGVAIICRGVLPDNIWAPNPALANAFSYAAHHMVRAKAWDDCVMLALLQAGLTITPDFLEHAVDVTPTGSGFLCSEAVAWIIISDEPGGVLALHRSDSYLMPLLWCAARAGYPSVASLLLEKARKAESGVETTLADAEWHEGGVARREPVLTAALHGRGSPAAKIELIRMLLDAGADPDACVGPNEAFLSGDESPLMAAAALGCVEACRLMLAAGGDPLAELPPFLSEREESTRAREWGFVGQDFREPWRCRSGAPSGASAYMLAAQHGQCEVLALFDAWKMEQCSVSDEDIAAWIVERAILKVKGELMAAAEAAAAASKAKSKTRRKTKRLATPAEYARAKKAWKEGGKDATVAKMLEAAVGAAKARGRTDAALRCPLCRGLREFKVNGLKAHLGSPRHADFFAA